MLFHKIMLAKYCQVRYTVRGVSEKMPSDLLDFEGVGSVLGVTFFKFKVDFGQVLDAAIGG